MSEQAILDGMLVTVALCLASPRRSRRRIRSAVRRILHDRRQLRSRPPRLPGRRVPARHRPPGRVHSAPRLDADQFTHCSWLNLETGAGRGGPGEMTSPPRTVTPSSWAIGPRSRWPLAGLRLEHRRDSSLDGGRRDGSLRARHGSGVGHGFGSSARALDLLAVRDDLVLNTGGPDPRRALGAGPSAPARVVPCPATARPGQVCARARWRRVDRAPVARYHRPDAPAPRPRQDRP